MLGLTFCEKSGQGPGASKPNGSFLNLLPLMELRGEEGREGDKYRWTNKPWKVKTKADVVTAGDGHTDRQAGAEQSQQKRFYVYLFILLLSSNS